MRKLGAVLAVVVALCLLAGCSSNKGAAPVTVAVQIVDGDGVIWLEETVENATTAEDAVVKACQKAGVAFDLENGMFKSFAGIPSTNTDGWLLYINAELAQVGAKDVSLHEGDEVVFCFVNYDKAFAQ